MFKRVIGVIVSIISVLGLLIGIGGAIAIPQVIASIQSSTGSVLGEVAGGLDSAEVTIVTVRNTIEEASKGLETAQLSTVDIATAINSTGPVIEEVNVVMGENVPASIETVQTALPNLIQVADTVDQTLLQLSQFDVNESLGGMAIPLPSVEVFGQEFELPAVTLPELPINFDLGIEYDPDTAFDESLIGIEANLEGIPESLRALSSSLDETRSNVLTVGDDVALISENIGAINDQVSLLPGQIDDYLTSFEQLQTNIVGAEETINTQLNAVRTALIVLFVWFALMQIAPLYIGVHLALGRRID